MFEPSSPVTDCFSSSIHTPPHPKRVKMMRCYRGKLSVWVVLCVLVLCWFYVFPGDRLPGDKEIVEEVLRQGEVWQKNQTGIDLYRFVSCSYVGSKQVIPLERPTAPRCLEGGSIRSTSKHAKQRMNTMCDK